jgi:hypothetical protein
MSSDCQWRFVVWWMMNDHDLLYDHNLLCDQYERWMMKDEWWMMNDEWWMMNDEWWMMKDENLLHDEWWMRKWLDE